MLPVKIECFFVIDIFFTYCFSMIVSQHVINVFKFTVIDYFYKSNSVAFRCELQNK